MYLRSILAMLLLTGLALAGLVWTAGVCLADETADRTQLAGAWDLGAGAGNTAWTIKETGDSVHLTYLRGTEKLADFDCATTGKECSVHMEGHSSKVTLYFNGPRLVMLETRGDTVVKWRFGAASEGRELEVETIPITPGGKTETLRYKRTDVQASNR
jgi:hypothetical protein